MQPRDRWREGAPGETATCLEPHRALLALGEPVDGGGGAVSSPRMFSLSTETFKRPKRNLAVVQTEDPSEAILFLRGCPSYSAFSVRDEGLTPLLTLIV